MTAQTATKARRRTDELTGLLLPVLRPGTRRTATGGLRPDPKRLPIVLHAFRRRAEGASLRSLRVELAAKGLRASEPYLAKMLADPFYATARWTVRTPSGPIEGRMSAGPLIPMHIYVQAQRPWLQRLDTGSGRSRPPVPDLPEVPSVCLLRLSMSGPPWLAARPQALGAVAGLAAVLRVPGVEVASYLRPLASVDPAPGDRTSPCRAFAP